MGIQGSQFDMVCADKILQKWVKTLFANVGERNINLLKYKPTPRKLLSVVDFILYPRVKSKCHYYVYEA